MLEHCCSSSVLAAALATLASVSLYTWGRAGYLAKSFVLLTVTRIELLLAETIDGLPLSQWAQFYCKCAIWYSLAKVRDD